MTTYTPRLHDDYIEWIENAKKVETDYLASIKEQLRELDVSWGDTPRHPEINNRIESLKKEILRVEGIIASLLANRDTLERHREQLVPAQFFPEAPLQRIVCSSCESRQFGKLSVPFPCDSYTDITKHLGEVM